MSSLSPGLSPPYLNGEKRLDPQEHRTYAFILPLPRQVFC
jgi:hypothetical protein